MTVVLSVIDGASYAAVPLVAGGLLIALSPLIISDIVASFVTARWTMPARWFGATFVVAGLTPLGWGLYLSASSDKLGLGIPIAIGCAFAVPVVAWVARVIVPERARFPIAVALAQLAFFFAEAHIVEQTLVVARGGTEHLRLAAFFAMWMGSVPLAVAWGYRIVDMARDETEHEAERRWFGWMMRLSALVVGVALLVGDRTYFQGLYPGFHTWMLFVGIVSVEVALIAPVARLVRPVRKPAAALVAVLTGVICSLPFVAPMAGDPFHRAAMDTMRLASLALRFQDAKPVAAGVEVDDHPLLDYPRYHDRGHDLPRFNMVLVSIDTLRWDWVGPNAVGEAETPTFDALARDSLWFERAYAPGPRTAIGMGCLLLGRYSVNLQWSLVVSRSGELFRDDEISDEKLESFGDDWGYTTLPTFPDEGTVAERIQAAGYHTMGLPFAKNIKFFASERGFSRGFDVYQDLSGKLRGKPTSSKIVKRAVGQWKTVPEDAPFFQWIHLFDPHESNARPKGYAEMVAATDVGLGELVDALKERGIWDETVLVVVSDHGEAMGEHGYRYHGHSLYDEQVRVPMLVRIPGVAPRVEKRPASTLDAAATLLSIARADSTNIDGVNLVPLAVEGLYPDERPVFTEMHRYRFRRTSPNRDAKALMVDNWKLLHNRKKNWVKLFDLDTDPAEEENVARVHPEVASRLTAALVSFINPAERIHPLPGLEPPPPVDAQ